MQRISSFFFLFIYDVRINLRVLTFVCPIKDLMVYISTPFSNNSEAKLCRPQWKVICFLMPDASIQAFKGREIQEASVNPSKTRASSSFGRSPHS